MIISPYSEFDGDFLNKINLVQNKKPDERVKQETELFSIVPPSCQCE
jgi:hypothetical protein